MDDQENEKFDELTDDEKIQAVDKRLGNHGNRLSHPKQLLDLNGETIHLVLSPFAKEQNISNCMLLTWRVGDVVDHYGNKITPDDQITFENDKIYLCTDYDDPNQYISLRDFNIVPNAYNNHAAFKDRSEFDAYSVYRKMCFNEDPGLSEIEGEYDYWVTTNELKEMIKAEKNQ